jgi:protein-glutamine gamma-glutamyltransferase
MPRAERGHTPPGEHALTCVVVCSAAAALGSATEAGDGTSVLTGVLWTGVIVATLLAAWRLRLIATRWPESPAITPVFVLLAVVPGLWNLVKTSLGFPGQPLEVLLLTGVQLVACGLAAASVWPGHQPLALVCALFSVMFAASISQAPVTALFVALFAMAGVAWLLASYWSAVLARLHGSQRGRRPRWVLLLPVAVLLAMAGLIGLAKSDRMLALGGFLRSSGGTGDYDEAAQRGVGNGDALVAGQDNIQSFGPIENAPFRSGTEPSLYDLYNDLFDEPARNTKFDRAISLPPDLSALKEQRMVKSQIAHREFSTKRGGAKRSTAKLESLNSDALFYVKGRTPIHLRMELFDIFDGEVWQAVPAEAPRWAGPLKIETIAGRPWLNLSPARALEIYGAAENHAVKVIKLKGTRIPLPAHVRGIHIDRLEDPGLFEWVGDGLVRMVRRELPELTAIHVKSQPADSRLLRSQTIWGLSVPEVTRLPEGAEIERIRALAVKWAGSVPRGWRQIEAVTRHLREEYTLDADARTPTDATPVVHFLFEAKRGPSYQFATAAAVMLRALGYSTRLVGGFYASPARYDALRLHTPVVGADAHVWAEVYLNGQTWLTVEATPGYEVLGPPPTYLDRVLAGLWAVGQRIVARKWTSLAIVVAMGLVWWTRAAWSDRLRLWVWRWWPARDARKRVSETWRLVERRLRRVGVTRAPGETPGGALARWSARVQPDVTVVATFARLVDWSVFAPEGVAAPSSEDRDVERLCRQMVDAVYAAPRKVEAEGLRLERIELVGVRAG